MRRRVPGSRQTPERVELDGGRVILICGDCAEVAPDLPPVHAVITDPPYGLGEAPDITACLADWMATGEHTPKARGGFMGQAWDAFVPGPRAWRAIVRRLYPGGHLVAFAGTRTADLMGIALRLAGLEVRDMVGWIQGQGFPKSQDLSKAVDKRRKAKRAITRTPMGATGNKYAAGLGDTRPWMQEAARVGYHEHESKEPATEAARAVQGQGSSLKPSIEPAWLCRKPIVGTLADTVERYGTGGLNIDAGRIGSVVETWPAPRSYAPGQIQPGGKGKTESTGVAPPGRWPPNVAFAHLPGCVRVGERTVPRHLLDSASKFTPSSGLQFGTMPGSQSLGTINESQPVFECEEGCPVAELARQSVARGPAKQKPLGKRGKGFTLPGGDKGDSLPNAPGYDDKGTAERFFPAFEPDVDPPFAYVPKASTSERDAGLESFEVRDGNKWNAGGIGERRRQAGLGQRANVHPTVKPVALMRWLVRLACPTLGRLLDPFMGSGTTGVAAVLEGRAFIGVERSPEYFAIAVARIEHAIATRDKTREHE
jgi:DNA modification methylase